MRAGYVGIRVSIDVGNVVLIGYGVAGEGVGTRGW